MGSGGQGKERIQNFGQGVQNSSFFGWCDGVRGSRAVLRGFRILGQGVQTTNLPETRQGAHPGFGVDRPRP